MGVNVEGSYVNQAAVKLGCQVLTSSFIYLGTKVGGTMSRVQAWQEVVEKVKSRLSKWKMKTLSIEGRLTLLKFVLAIHGVNGNVNSSEEKAGRSCWLAIVDEVRALHKKGGILKDLFPRMSALENMKEVTVSFKLNDDNLADSFRRSPRGN
uniref:RNA-directed DNA polymerase, eukaryota n=1 Tax=Tanacetum cinerariifolium TaxID=118510 RepID=A0A6L2MSX0_TANCI|nr:RNA-directed DNA polymerase, eukaryota [Tanacetum cinerariifolium]